MRDARHNQKHSGRVTRSGGSAVDSSGVRSSDGTSGRANPDALRILWYSNAPFTNSGYGQQTAQITQRLKEDNHEIAIHAMYGLEGSSSFWNGIKVYPRGSAAYSDDITVAHWMDWRNGNKKIPSLLMTLFDVWVLKSKSFDSCPNIASWVPIDHQPAPPEVLAWCSRDNVRPIAMSKFGSRMLDVAGIEHFYVPHAIESSFEPTPVLHINGTKVTGRQLMGDIPEDKFVVMMNAANKGASPSRKSFGENLLAFSIFAQDRPDAILYLHTDPSPNSGGILLTELIAACGLREDQYKIVDAYAFRTGFPQEALAAMYSDSDVLLACSMGEGFGLAVIEAQACGTPVIVSDFTAQPELVGAGWKVEVQPYWDGLQFSWFCVPRIPSIVDALRQAYEAPRGVNRAAVEFAKAYQADAVYEAYWKPTLKGLSEWCRSSSSPS